MAKILFADKASTTMTGSLASGLGTLTVASGGGAKFPAPTGGDYFYATLYQKDGGGAEINIEVVKITAKPSADSFTISERDVTNITGYGGGYAYPGTAGTVYVELRWLEKAAAAMMQSADMIASNIANTPAGGIAATTVQAALNELDTEKAPLASPAFTGTPTVPTAGAGTNNTQAASTAFVASAVSTHNALTAAHGVTGNIVGTTDNQVLTNKTIVVANNTITTAASGNLTSTNLNAALAELQTDIDTRATAAALSAHQAETVTHGATGAVVGTTNTQTLQNKTLDSTCNISQATGAIPAGAVMSFAMNSAPTGWLSCDGSAVSRTTYAALFSAIGTTYGVGNGSTTFNLPDLRGYFVRGSGTNSDGTASGAFAAKQTDLVAQHTHTLAWGATFATPTGSAYTTGGGGTAINGANALAQNDGSLYAAATGVGTGAETRPKNIAMLYCIKT